MMEEERPQTCNLAWRILMPSGMIDMDAWGHVVPQSPQELARIRDRMIQLLEQAPDNTQLIEFPLGLVVVVHLTPEKMRELVNQAGHDLAYIGAVKLREANEGYEG